MSSGVTVHDDCKLRYEEVKKDKKYRYVIFFIKDEKQIQVETLGERDASYDDFLADLQKAPNECRYGLFDFEYVHQCQGTTEATKKEKMFLLNWCPENAKIRSKMVNTSSYDALKKALVGVPKCLQATELSECSYQAVEGKLRETDRN